MVESKVKDCVMDTTKWKSIAVPLDAYEKVRALAEENERSIARQITFLIRQATTANGESGSNTRRR